MSELRDWLQPDACPAERPPLSSMSERTRQLHDSLDAHARRSGLPYLHPDDPTVQLDLFGSARAIAWQEGKAAFMFAGEGCWSELPHLYARYGTTATGALISRVKALEHAGAALVCDSGMQATALVFDVLMGAGRHAVLMRQVYNKTRSYLEWLASRVGATITIVDDGDRDALAAAITPETVCVFAETFTNPLVRAQDLDMLREVVARGPRPRAGPSLDHRFHDCDAVGLLHAAARSGRRRGAGQRHQGARRHRSRSLGIRGHERRASRHQRDGPAGHARRHPRLAARAGHSRHLGRGGARRTRGDRPRRRGWRRSWPRTPASVTSITLRWPHIPMPPPSGGTTSGTARCSRSASTAPMKPARGTSPTCSPRPSSCATRCRSMDSPPR